MVIFILIVLALAIWLEWYIATQFYNVAEQKGHDEMKYFWLCFAFTFVGYLLVIALPDRHAASTAPVTKAPTAPSSVKAPSNELPDL